ncbi:unnamed protein product [Blepharisma stoltei]|uniref:Uncharacterized protein n=1 Tax=Blepharisma stoltei TaxID=1481888 RepID=A0AAU9IL08_9CILI|nr:unnamed protein product [Blepharisma stoltei]
MHCNQILIINKSAVAKNKISRDIVKINNENLKERRENLFIVQDPKSAFDVNNYKVFERNIKYFKGKDLFVADVISQSSASQNINKNFQEWDPTCLLDDGSVFCCFQAETFIITPNNSIIPLDSSKYGPLSGLIAVNYFVYMFEGTANASLKFSQELNDWTAIAQYPVSNNRYISCAFINGAILIGGYDSPSMHGYIVSNNLYANIPITLNFTHYNSNMLQKEKKAWALTLGFEFRKYG